MRSTQSKQRVRAGHFNFTAYLNKAGLALTHLELAQEYTSILHLSICLVCLVCLVCHSQRLSLLP